MLPLPINQMNNRQNQVQVSVMSTSVKEKSNKKENKGMGSAHQSFDGVFLGIGIKTGE
jgi:hypothetical protein